MTSTSVSTITSPPITHRILSSAKTHDTPTVTEIINDESGELYTPWRLAIYDFWVLGLVNTYAWGCSTTSYLLPLFRANVRHKHLDVGVGTGYYLDPSSVPASTRLTLVDSEASALAVAKLRSQQPDANAVVADVLSPLPLEDKFDSVSMYYLLHCMPVSVPEKCRVFALLKERMAPDGVLTGANVLGKGVARDNYFGAFIRRGCTNHGIFHNKEDNAFDFERALRDNFNKVETWVVGSVFIFRAEEPKD